VIIPVAAIIAGLPLLGLPPAYDTIVAQASSLFNPRRGILADVQIVGVGERFILLHYDVSGPDNLRAADGAKSWISDVRFARSWFFSCSGTIQSLPRERSETRANITRMDDQ